MTTDILIETAKKELSILAKAQACDKRQARKPVISVNDHALLQTRIAKRTVQINHVEKAINWRHDYFLTLILESHTTSCKRASLTEKLHSILNVDEIETLRGMLHHSITI